MPAVAAQLDGVTLEDRVTAGKQELQLNGMAVRTRFFFKVYVAGLYLENSSRDAAAVVSSEQIKQMSLHVLRSLKASQVTEAIEEGFEKNSKQQMGNLKDRLKKFDAMFSDVKDGDQILMTYGPGKGTSVSIKGVEKGTVEGKDFADALYNVWLGQNPVQEDLKKALLGG